MHKYSETITPLEAKRLFNKLECVNCGRRYSENRDKCPFCNDKNDVIDRFAEITASIFRRTVDNPDDNDHV